MARDYPVRSRATDLTRRMQRDAKKLPPEQVIREILVVNPAEHAVEGADNIAIADVEKLAATHLRDTDGKPVFRRIWMDNCSGIPRDDMPHLLFNYGESSKSSEVFSGNHGEGAILSGAPINPNGLVFISKDAEHDMPYVCIFDFEVDEDGNVEAGLVAFESDTGAPPIADADTVPYLPHLTDDQGDFRFTMLDVWNSAYSNTKFPKGPPAHGVVVLELGESDEDSTYIRTQRTFDSGRGKGTWNYSRWAVGEYVNSRFRRFPDNIKYFWGVPGDRFAFNFGKATRNAPAYGWKVKHDALDFVSSKNWTYREAKGLDDTVMGTGSDDPDSAAYKDAKIITDSADYLDGPIPFTAEVIIRELADPRQARKLAFNARRYGRVFIDYNDEVFQRTEGNPHELFGVDVADAKYSVWIAIKPHKIGVEEPGAVWMGTGRTVASLSYVDEYKLSHDIPWPTLGRQFREKMPPKLLEWLQVKDAAEPDEEISEPEIKRFFERFIDETKPLPPKPKTRKTLASVTAPATGDPDPDGETRTKGRGPVVNPGVAHPPGDGTHKRRSPSKRIPLIKKLNPDGVDGLADTGITGGTGTTEDDDVSPPDTTPQPPMHKWVDDDTQWPEDHDRWGVIYDPPSELNDGRGRIRLRWHYWYIQEVNDKLVAKTSKPRRTKRVVQHVFLKSALSKVVHRLDEASMLKLTDEERAEMFSPMALTGYLLGWWDHDHHLNAGLKAVAAAEHDEPDSDEEVA